jgi:hypothetical protein
MPNKLPLPEDQLHELADNDPEMLAQVIKQLHESAQRERQQRLNEVNES